MPSPLAPTCTIEGVAFGNVTMDETIALIQLMVQKGEHVHHICTGNLDHLYLLQKDADFRKAYETASLVLADGMPVVWLSRMQRGKKPLRERVAGSDLFWKLAQVSQKTQLRLFFLGGAPGSAQAAAEKVQERYPGAQIVGVYCPPHDRFSTAAEQTYIRDMIREAAPDVLLVGLGAPKQEKWMLQNKASLGVPVSVGVGGTFEMAAGTVKRAPQWLQRLGLEWAFRLLQDPGRLYRRYICNDMPFLLRAVTRVFLSNLRKQEAPAPPVERTTTTPVAQQTSQGI